jgi:hypothetical protein
MEFLNFILQQNGHNLFIAFIFLVSVITDIVILIVVLKVLVVVEKCKRR